MANVKIASSLIPSTVDTPLDARCRVAAEADILNIENPAVGQLVYCIANGKFYVIDSLKAKESAAFLVENAAVGSYKEFSLVLTDEEKEALLDELENRLLNGEWGTEA